MVTAPVKAYVVVIYRPPGQLGNFVHELDTLLSSIPEHECPMLILGDMNIHLDNPNSADIHSLIRPTTGLHSSYSQSGERACSHSCPELHHGHTNGYLWKGEFPFPK